jgi:hypothetical protein
MTSNGAAAAISVRLGEEDFRNLPIDDKRVYLDGVLSKEKAALIAGDPDDQKLTRAMWIISKLM